MGEVRFHIEYKNVARNTKLSSLLKNLTKRNNHEIS